MGLIMPMKHRLYTGLVGTALLLVNANALAHSDTAHVESKQCQLNILLTNDDGWQAPGIQSLFKSLQHSPHKVTMVAPLTQQSGRSSAINTAVGSSVSIKEQAPNVWSVDGTPADSVKAALGIVLVDNAPDLLISGANFGPNVGQQTVLNSGTLGASLTAHHAGIPVIAMSVGMDVKERKTTPAYKSTIEGFETASLLVNRMISKLIAQNGCDTPLAGKHILSINVPVPVGQIKGIKYAPLSPNELFHLTWHTDNNVNKITYSQTDKSAALNDDDVGYFLRKFITVTPISGDLTQGKADNAPTTEWQWLPDLSGVDLKQ